ncbi:PLP-dependent decarboxylase [uncultured Microbulbifer sp.]|uniref:PLP-dependent decarboxylase n=1 Tax=uncultured Microbulbifer sp. TaxID=348147 RepID=UPI002605180E|nr:PLP-dependent decarboxylase [uncultured Microbulbifer sp.]
MNVSLKKVITQLRENKQYFSTPCYVYSIEDVANNYKKLKGDLGTSLIYSLKANSCLDLILRCGHIFEDGVEIASIGELNLLPRGQVFRYINNPSADKKFLRSAVSSNSVLVVDNLSQLGLIKEVQVKRSINPLVLRLNHSILDKFGVIPGRVRSDHFGLSWGDALAALDICKKNHLTVAGFHIFRGSYSFIKLANITAQAALHITKSFESALGYPIAFVNLGGGIESHWQNQKFEFSRYRSLLSEFPSYIQIAHESGRAIMETAGYFVTKVRYVKWINKTQYGICDGGMAQNFLLAKTEQTFRRLQEPIIVRKGIVVDSGDTANCGYLVGTSCNRDDVIGKVMGKEIEPEDLAIFCNCGAYNASYTLAHFLRLPPAKSYLME